MLDREKIAASLQTCEIPYTFWCLDETDSTNLVCRRLAMEADDAKESRSNTCRHGMVITAEQQTAGRGRRGRVWQSPKGENLYTSLLLFPEFSQEKAAMLTLVAAQAAAEAIRQAGLDAKIKWPNDVVINGKKVCGILTELGWRADGRYFVIIGTGINVNQSVFADEISCTASSVFLQKGQKMQREVLLAAMLEKFSFYYNRFAQRGDLSEMRSVYEEILVNCGQTVKVLDPKGEWQGTALGITDTGELLVQREDGSIENVYAGEVSVRGIYGYV